jgi:hypothetical protein
MTKFEKMQLKLLLFIGASVSVLSTRTNILSDADRGFLSSTLEQLSEDVAKVIK